MTRTARRRLVALPDGSAVNGIFVAALLVGRGDRGGRRNRRTIAPGGHQGFQSTLRQGEAFAAETAGRDRFVGPGVAWLNSPPLKLAGLRGSRVGRFLDVLVHQQLANIPYVRARRSAIVTTGSSSSASHALIRFESVVRTSRGLVTKTVRSSLSGTDGQRLRDLASVRQRDISPADYLVDGTGRISYHHFGEGDARDRTPIRKLLKKKRMMSLSPEVETRRRRRGQAPPGTDLGMPDDCRRLSPRQRFASQDARRRTPSNVPHSGKPVAQPMGPRRNVDDRRGERRARHSRRLHRVPFP